jgi:hypothetical protein
MIKELDVVALTCDVPEDGLRAGDIGTVVLEHGTAAYEVEFINFGGDTIAVVTLEANQVRLVGPGEVRQVRPLEKHPQ